MKEEKTDEVAASRSAGGSRESSQRSELTYYGLESLWADCYNGHAVSPARCHDAITITPALGWSIIHNSAGLECCVRSQICQQSRILASLSPSLLLRRVAPTVGDPTHWALRSPLCLLLRTQTSPFLFLLSFVVYLLFVSSFLLAKFIVGFLLLFCLLVLFFSLLMVGWMTLGFW